MQTIPNDTHQPLRDAIAADADPIELLLASTLIVAHDGTLERDDGVLPKGVPLPLGVSRDSDGGWAIGAYADVDAVRAPDAPTAGDETPTVPIAGDDLLVLAAANHVGVDVNPGSDEHLLIDARHARELARYIKSQRSRSGVRTFDERTLVTLRPIDDLELSRDRHELLVRELASRGASLAFLAQYALHDQLTDPTEFTQLVVVGDEEGRAGYRLREDARRVVGFLTGVVTDSVAYQLDAAGAPRRAPGAAARRTAPRAARRRGVDGQRDRSRILHVRDAVCRCLQ